MKISYVPMPIGCGFLFQNLTQLCLPIDRHEHLRNMADSRGFHFRWEIEDISCLPENFCRSPENIRCIPENFFPENCFIMTICTLSWKHFILLQMSLFNRKVLQIGVVANLTLLQKYCILNVGNTLVEKSGQYVVNVWPFPSFRFLSLLSFLVKNQNQQIFFWRTNKRTEKNVSWNIFLFVSTKSS